MYSYTSCIGGRSFKYAFIHFVLGAEPQIYIPKLFVMKAGPKICVYTLFVLGVGPKMYSYTFCIGDEA